MRIWEFGTRRCLESDYDRLLGCGSRAQSTVRRELTVQPEVNGDFHVPAERPGTKYRTGAPRDRETLEKTENRETRWRPSDFDTSCAWDGTPSLVRWIEIATRGKNARRTHMGKCTPVPWRRGYFISSRDAVGPPNPPIQRKAEPSRDPAVSRLRPR